MPNPRLQAIIRRSVKRTVPQIQASVNQSRRDFAAKLIARMQKYPPQLSGAHYRRTGHLGKGWQFRLVGLDTVVVFNNVDYAAQVEGDSPGQQLKAFGEKRSWPALNVAARTILELQYPQWKKSVSLTTTSTNLRNVAGG